jgi:ketosteroid isomerase-like protein
VFDDRRRFNLLSGDVELMVAAARERVTSGARPVRRRRGTAGDRVAIEVLLWSGGPADGRFEIEYLGVTEVDESGLLVTTILLDLDDPRAAQREAWARWMAIDPTVAELVTAVSETIDSWNAMDRRRFAREYTDDFVVEDHRRTGMGRLDGVEAYMASVEALWQLAPDSRLELGWHWLAVDRRGGVVTCRRTGRLADGGAYESDYLVLFIVEDGRARRLEMFEVDAADAALARFEALRTDPP